MRILIVEDDPRVADILRRALTESGYAVDVRGDARSGLFTAETESYDLIVLDIMLPGLEGGGLAVCRRLRTAGSGVPILMLTALDAPSHRVGGLDTGADDYLTKPFHLPELLARVRALLRRTPHTDRPLLIVGDLTLDSATRTARRGERVIPLTAREFAVLQYLMRSPETIVSPSELIDHAWDGNYEGYSNVVQTYIRYLRRKLTAQGEVDLILTHRGHGYSIRVQP